MTAVFAGDEEIYDNAIYCIKAILAKTLSECSRNDFEKGSFDLSRADKIVILYLSLA